MFRLQGPFPAFQTTVVLPSPEFGNTRGLQSAVQTVRTMNGTLSTFIKGKRARKAHQWDFIVSKEKSMEIKAFIDLYISSLVRIVDQDDNTIVGFVTINPFEMVGEGRAGGWPGGDAAYRFTLQLEENV